MRKLSVKDNLAIVRDQLSFAATKVGRSPEEIKIIAVSKKKSTELINEAILSNHTAFGENMIQEAIKKISAFSNTGNIEWHMIGHLQKNKVKFCPGNFHWIHSIDSTELAKKLEDRCASKKQNINVLIQVNLSEEKRKYGVRKLSDLYQIAETLYAGHWIKLRGLMTIPETDLGEVSTRRIFEKVRMWNEKLRNELGAPEINELSMGMSNDFQWAINEGATMVRLGTAIFGPR